MTSAIGRDGRTPLLLGACLLGLVLGAGCTSGSSTPGPTGSTAEASPTDPTDEPGSPTGTAQPPLPNPAPSTIAKVERPGSAVGPTATVPISGFGAPAVYPDGVSVSIPKAVKAIETGSGPGAFPGRELVVFDIVLENSSSESISLNEVVVTTYYGLSRQIAAPVYAAAVDPKDFAGTVAPGTKATARYAFAVPANDLVAVTTVVDFDAKHASAFFAGAVQTS